jgi:hypothetical protein
MADMIVHNLDGRFLPPSYHPRCYSRSGQPWLVGMQVAFLVTAAIETHLSRR